jgi:hypothetical protein
LFISAAEGFGMITLTEPPFASMLIPAVVVGASITRDGVSGMAGLSLNGTVTPSLVMEAPTTTAALDMNASGGSVRIITPKPSVAEINNTSSGRNFRRLFGKPETAIHRLAMNGTAHRNIIAPKVYADIETEMSGGGTRRLFGNATQARMTLGAATQGTRLIHASRTQINILCNLNGRSRRLIFGNGADSTLNLESLGMADMYGYAVLDLEGLTLMAGGELIIDTGQMTVTLNGQDVTRYVARNSEFFKLRPGDNIIVYEDGAVNRNISYNILWKDLWL